MSCEIAIYQDKITSHDVYTGSSVIERVEIFDWKSAELGVLLAEMLEDGVPNGYTRTADPGQLIEALNLYSADEEVLEDDDLKNMINDCIETLKEIQDSPKQNAAVNVWY